VRIAVTQDDASICRGEDTTGYANVDVDLTTGRVVHFERFCQENFASFTRQYRQSGTGEPDCDLTVCNDVVNDAPQAVVKYTIPSTSRITGQPPPLPPLAGDGALTTGTYHLKTVEYPADSTCWDPGLPEERPSPISETLVLTVKSATTGTISWASQRANFAPTRSTLSYELTDSGPPSHQIFLRTHYVCGEESLSNAEFGTYGTNDGALNFSAADGKLKLQLPAAWCQDDSATSDSFYTYEKE
jgi:hypothetical protein